jgi:cob(I)alamin adenosyltransferase
MNTEEFNLKKWFDMAFRIFSSNAFSFINLSPTPVIMDSYQDIEEAHSNACRENNMFYTDPYTSLSVLTETAHLKRGKCCGNMCRHCPYGWERVRSLTELSLIEVHEKCVSKRSGLGGSGSGIGRQVGEFLNSGDKIQCDSELDDWKRQKIINSTQDLNGLNSPVPFTKGGDKGTSALPTGERLSKTSDCFMVLGSVDELCSFVGLAHSMLIDKSHNSEDMEHITEIEKLLFEITQKLFDVGGVVATRGGTDVSSSKGPLMTFHSSNTDDLEAYITKQTTTFLPTLTNFILPLGSILSSQLHVCRSVCRRVERDYVRYLEARNSGTFESDSISVYLNRLSDFFFTASRVVNLVDKRRPENGNTNTLLGRGDVKFVGTGEGGLKRGVRFEDESDEAKDWVKT